MMINNQLLKKTLKFSKGLTTLLAPLRRWNNFTHNSSFSTSDSEFNVVKRLTRKPTPWLMLPPEIDFATGEKLDCFRSLIDGKTVKLKRQKTLKVSADDAICIGSTMGWLTFVERNDLTVKLLLSDPYNNKVVNLPCIEKLPNVMRVIKCPEAGINYYEVMEDSYRKYYYNDYWTIYDVNPCYRIVGPRKMAERIFNVTLSNDPRGSGWLSMLSNRPQPTVMAICNSQLVYGNVKNGNIYTRIVGKENWTSLSEWFWGSRGQVVYCKIREVFYTLINDRVSAYDVHNATRRRRRKELMKDISGGELKHLINAEFKNDSEELKELRMKHYQMRHLATLPNGDLLLIMRYYKKIQRVYMTPATTKTMHIDVVKFTNKGSVERVSSIGRCTIFLDLNQSFYLKANAKNGLTPNSIYFLDGFDPFEGVRERGYDVCRFDFKDGTIETPSFPNKDGDGKEKSNPISNALYWVAPPS